MSRRSAIRRSVTIGPIMGGIAHVSGRGIRIVPRRRISTRMSVRRTGMRVRIHTTMHVGIRVPMQIGGAVGMQIGICVAVRI